MTRPLRNADVTVIVPAHDAEATIERTLASLLDQTGGSPSVVVVDDGSTDTTSKWALRMGARLLRTEHVGPGGARNAGIAAANSPIVAFCDADDEWIHDRLLHDLADFDDDPAVLVTLGRSRFETKDPSLLDGHCFPDDDRVAFIPHFGAASFRIGTFKRSGLIDASLKNFEDYEFFYRLRDLGIRVHSHERVTQIRHILAGSTSHRTPPSPTDLMSVMQRSLQRRRRNGHLDQPQLSTLGRRS